MSQHATVTDAMGGWVLPASGAGGVAQEKSLFIAFDAVVV